MSRRTLAATAQGALSVFFPIEPLMALEATALDRLQRAFFFLDEDEDEGADGETCDPVRVVHIRGPLVHHASWWWCSYEDVRADFKEAIDDPACEAIVLRIDSPGGYAAGMGETVRAMREAKAAAGKPVLAYVDEMACSAAYGLATVADEIWLPASGTTGSVGTMLTVYDESKLNEKMGLRVEVITSGEQKADGHRDVPLTSAALGRLRERVEDLAGLFVAQVADARRMTPAAVAGLQAGVFLGAKAIEAGLADRLASLEETLAEAARRGAAAKASRSAPLALTPGASAPQPHETHMKSLFAKLGLPETASEAEALVALSAITDAQRELLATTGKASTAEAIGTVRGWSKTAVAHADLVAKVEADKAAARAASVEAIFKAALETGRRTPAEVDAARKSIAAGTLSLDTDEKVAAYKAELEASPVRLPGASVAGGPLAPSSDGALVGASWEQMSTEAKHRLYNENPAAYQALKAAHQQQQKKR